MTLWAQINSDCTINFLTRSLHSYKELCDPYTETVALVVRSLVDVQKSGIQTVPGPFLTFQLKGPGRPAGRSRSWLASTPCRASPDASTLYNCAGLGLPSLDGF